jgi:hypothetical protein
MSQDPDVRQHADMIPESTIEDFLYLFFSPSQIAKLLEAPIWNDVIFEGPMLIRLARIKRSFGGLICPTITRKICFATILSLT